MSSFPEVGTPTVKLEMVTESSHSITQVPATALSGQLEEHGLDTPNLGNTPTRLLRITVANDGSLTQSGLPLLDKARLPHDLFTSINQAYSSNHLPPYTAPNFQRFPDVDNLIKTFLAPGTVVLVLVRDVADGNIGPSDFVASFGLTAYSPPLERPDPINDPGSSWRLYIDPNNGESARQHSYLRSLRPDCSRCRRVTDCPKVHDRESVISRSRTRKVDDWKFTRT